MVATKDKSEALRVECVSTAYHWELKFIALDQQHRLLFNTMRLASSNVLVLIWENTNTIRFVQITFLYYTNTFCNFDKYNVQHVQINLAILTKTMQCCE